ncbi:preprotein translocase, SecG subunit [Desulfovibrio sp. X2]|uniref:preprotein translocase subunit SecG n=1 Tax=Desulfovibrio sp. X2 TaxID=941449 RepID=UPI000358CC5A|nr:preprotein translocase subunit SecG [Desulfovibrio sp. X2]EPR42302.1 preprotein translocase, SecG subunit [Desulfovibrio sp. X2]
MSGIVLTLHIIACLVLIVLVLLQSGKEGMGVIFGGGSSSVFGSSGAGGLLVKATAVLAVIFLLTSLTYNRLTGVKAVATDSIMMTAPEPKAEAAKPKPEVTFEEPAKPQAPTAAQDQAASPAPEQKAPQAPAEGQKAQ